MAQVFKINGTTLNYVMAANWEERGVGNFLNGLTSYNRYRRHTLATNVMTAAEFSTLFALEGQQVSLTTTNYTDRNGDYIDYHGVEIKSVTGQHAGPVVQDVQIECLVRI